MVRRLVLDKAVALAFLTSEILVRRIPFRILARSLHFNRNSEPIQEPQPFAAADLAVIKAIERVSARRPSYENCLVKAMAGYLVLRLSGRRPRVLIGVRRDEGRFQAHAWLEVNEHVVIGGSGPTSDFAPLRVQDWPGSILWPTP